MSETLIQWIKDYQYPSHESDITANKEEKMAHNRACRGIIAYLENFHDGGEIPITEGMTASSDPVQILVGLLEPISQQVWHGKWRIQKALEILRNTPKREYVSPDIATAYFSGRESAERQMPERAAVNERLAHAERVMDDLYHALDNSIHACYDGAVPKGMLADQAMTYHEYHRVYGVGRKSDSIEGGE